MGKNFAAVNVLIVFQDLEHIGFATYFTGFGHVFTELCHKIEFSVMAELICILCKLTKGAITAMTLSSCSLTLRYIFRPLYDRIRPCFHWIMPQNRLFRNGGTNLHIMQIAQGCQGGTRHILEIDPSKKSKLQRNVVWTVKLGSSPNLGFTSGLLTLCVVLWF